MAIRLFRIFTAISLALVLGVSADAQDRHIPDPGALDIPNFRADLDAVCGSGSKLSEGCGAIRARKIADSTLFPWRAIGRVNFASIEVRQHCTGTLIGETLVLTAAHCLYSLPRRNWIPASSIRFAAGYSKGTALSVSTVERYVLDPAHNPASRDFLGDPTNDWALLVLSDPVGAELGFLDTEPEFDRINPILAGYAGLRPHVLSLAEDCGPASLDRSGKILWAKCSAMHGDSGAPLIVLGNGTPKVIGVFSAILTDGHRTISAAVPVSNFSKELNSLFEK